MFWFISHQIWNQKYLIKWPDVWTLGATCFLVLRSRWLDWLTNSIWFVVTLALYTSLSNHINNVSKPSNHCWAFFYPRHPQTRICWRKTTLGIHSVMTFQILLVLKIVWSMRIVSKTRTKSYCCIAFGSIFACIESVNLFSFGYLLKLGTQIANNSQVSQFFLVEARYDYFVW